MTETALQRFLRYVKIDTQSMEDSESYPSTAKQLDLLKLLVQELRELGAADGAFRRTRTTRSWRPTIRSRA